MRIVAVVILLALAAGSALIFTAARSDFTFRGCPDIPREDWVMTVNCSDGSLAQLVFGGITALCLGLAILVGLRRRRT